MKTPDQCQRPSGVRAYGAGGGMKIKTAVRDGWPCQRESGSGYPQGVFFRDFGRGASQPERGAPRAKKSEVYDIHLLLPSTQTPCSLNILAGICAIPPMWTTRSSSRDRARWGCVWLCGRVRTQLTLVMRLMQRLMEVEIELR